MDRKLDLAKYLSVTPEAHVIYQTVRLNAGNDHLATCSMASFDAAYCRLDARLSKVWDIAFGGEVCPLITLARAAFGTTSSRRRTPRSRC